ncbi:uncharacterized protein FYW47_007160 [Aplochiton taeniatus]
MLHSAGIFADIACPFFRRGLCDRPHCVYKHADEDQDMFGNLYESSVTKVSAGHHPTPINGATVDTDNQVKCFLELERINKEIETVKNEVEKEQRRLSHYQTVQVDSRSKGWKNALDKSKTKGVNGNSTRQSSRKHSTKPYSSAKKYMVDNSRPRTDLEYDPLSNFSADLRPSSSTGKEQKVKCCAKRTRDSDQKKSPSTQLVDESEEEGVLIIDVPLSPNKNISRHPKLCRSYSAAPQEDPEETYRRIDPVVGGNVLLLVTESGLVESDLPNITFREMNPAQPNEVSCVNLNDYSLCSSYPTFLPLSQDQRVEQPAQSMVQSYWSPMQSAPLVSCFPKIPSQTHNVSFSTSNSALPSNYLEQAAATAGIKLCQPPQVPSTSGQSSMANGEPLPSTPIQQPVLETEGGELEAVRSVAEEELNYSDVDLSDSDPMEECYKIFMEAKREEEAKSTERLFVPTVAKSQSVARSRLQTQTIVPLRGPGPASVHQVVNSSRIQQLQHKACQLTAALKGGQAFVSSATQRNVVTLAPPIAQTPPPLATSTVTQPLQNVNYLPVGTAIQVGNNLHFILPEGSYTLPMASIASHVTSVITPVQTSQPVSTKRKVKQRPEVGAKVPHDVRQRYVNMFVEEFLKTSTTVQKAFEKALAEEKTVYERSVNKLKYMSVAVNALKRLKNQSTSSAKAENETSVQQLKGSIPLNVKALKGNDDTALYASLKEHILTEEMLAENNYPLQHPENPGSAILFADTKKSIFDALKRICCRCGATYSVGQTGKHARKEECTYHYGKGVEKKVPGGVETRYSCCEGVVGAPGCQVFKLHVHDAVSLDGFVSTLPRTFLEKDCPGVYSVDCEMCYTTHGLELSRVTVVNSSVQVVYDTFVRPDHEVIDYNTRFSSVSEKDLKGTSLTIRDVQETLLKFIMADTILIGHKLETDLCALKLLHATVVDTSVVFPHRLGPPHKLTLHHLTADYLRKIIQESVCGHDTAEDAAACMELMLGKVKEDGKARRW